MSISVIIFALMPFLDRSRIPGGSRYRPVYRALFYVFMADVLILGYVGSQPPEGNLVVIGEWATYFATFILLPVVSTREEQWLRRRGLPPAVMELLKNDETPDASREDG